jgi:hypothetical protein
MAQKKQIKIVFMAKNFREDEENIIEENITVLMRHFKKSSGFWIVLGSKSKTKLLLVLDYTKNRANSRDFEGDSNDIFQHFAEELNQSLKMNINPGGRIEFLFQDIRHAFMPQITNRFIFFEHRVLTSPAIHHL